MPELPGGGEVCVLFSRLSEEPSTLAVGGCYGSRGCVDGVKGACGMERTRDTACAHSRRAIIKTGGRATACGGSGVRNGDSWPGEETSSSRACTRRTARMCGCCPECGKARNWGIWARAGATSPPPHPQPDTSVAHCSLSSACRTAAH
jgi:hypothetical protein